MYGSLLITCDALADALVVGLSVPYFVFLYQDLWLFNGLELPALPFLMFLYMRSLKLCSLDFAQVALQQSFTLYEM